ncbi:ABC transporter ATP-binding protein [Pasteurella bettyae]|uniref:ABC transporter, ATP-binding protein n=1 Tax=Pasteurella bettyae CCUG 2042 TaxID=1095749 RepID=I3DFC1_9PAST|nr:dipeptide/oligopeptide/nickel ABC transporter ATP-binding protein [Pasteurella bettyae]EIJ70414.1 ABC transporter, ATP-binding protein [Pasteurella bettyae CCUG 2042]SUB21096.1 dipeptide transport ATP-binding protein DppF [Pasteurella bettyae]
MCSSPLLSVEHISKSYSSSFCLLKSANQQVLNDVSFHLDKGQSLGLVGESGSGKSTLARLICGIEKPDCGSIWLNEQSIFKPSNRLNSISLVFQDYQSSINPTMTVFQAISEPLRIQGNYTLSQLQQRVVEYLDKVNLSADLMSHYVYQLSGGQAQRVCICRALITHPSLIVLDEPVSSLDLVTQVQILDLLIRLKQDFNLSYFFITHNIQVLCYLCEQVLFFKQGQIVEQSAVQNLKNVTSDYAIKLLSSVI